VSDDEYKAEVERLRKFALAISQRLFLAAEVLARNAERKTKKAEAVTSAVVWIDGGAVVTGTGR